MERYALALGLGKSDLKKPVDFKKIIWARLGRIYIFNRKQISGIRLKTEYWRSKKKFLIMEFYYKVKT